MNSLRQIADPTMTIIGSGGYQTTAGASVSVAADVAPAVAGTRLYPAGRLPPAPVHAASARALTS